MWNTIVTTLKIGLFCLRLYLKMQNTANFLAIIFIRQYCTKSLNTDISYAIGLNITTTTWQMKQFYAHAVSGDTLGDCS